MGDASRSTLLTPGVEAEVEEEEVCVSEAFLR